MSTAVEVVVGSLYASHQALRESVIDLTPEEYLVCSTEGAECPAWVLGHALVYCGRRGHSPPNWNVYRKTLPAASPRVTTTAVFGHRRWTGSLHRLRLTGRQSSASQPT